MPSIVAADEGDAQVCARSAQRAAQETGVPFAVLMAIAKTETGRKIADRVTPWPWTINTRGEGKWLKTRAELQTLAALNLSQGITSFDVGCFQINYRWHGGQFSNLSEMIEPDANARYAARFLKQHYQEFGNWPDAAGAYHSRTEVHADRYKKLFARHYADTTPPSPPPSINAQRSGKRPNRFPLLKRNGGAIVLGSLVTAESNANTSLLGSLVR